jgi:hypothetical protein
VKLQEKLKTALDETRLLILGAQIVFGFHLNGVFQDAFDKLSSTAKATHAVAFVLMVLTIGLLIAPSMQHRLIERGEATGRIHRAATLCATSALLPFGASLALDLSIVIQHQFNQGLAVSIGATFFALAMIFWYLLEWRKERGELLEKAMAEKGEKTPLHAKVEQMLTEARVLLPGAQALLGFQMAIMLTSAFEKLSEASKIIHLIAFCSIALTIILLMSPAAFHRISYGGEDSEQFHQLGSRFVIAAGIPLAFGIVCDIHVAISKTLESPLVGCLVALLGAGIVMGYGTSSRCLSARRPLDAITNPTQLPSRGGSSCITWTLPVIRQSF